MRGYVLVSPLLLHLRPSKPRVSIHHLFGDESHSVLVHKKELQTLLKSLEELRSSVPLLQVDQLHLGTAASCLNRGSKVQRNAGRAR